MTEVRRRKSDKVSSPKNEKYGSKDSIQSSPSKFRSGLYVGFRKHI